LLDAGADINAATQPKKTGTKLLRKGASALTLAIENGRFELTGVPPGNCRIKIWHPYIRDEITQSVAVAPKGTSEVSFSVPAPTGRLYANQMVENPYNRYHLTDDEQSQIVPALEKQAY